MQSDKENLHHTPSGKEAKKRPPLQSPFSAASPNVRPAPKKIIKPFYELGDQNLDATGIVEESFNMSSVKTGLSESIVETSYVSAGSSSAALISQGDEAAHRSLAEHVGDDRRLRPLLCDDNLEESAFGHTFTANESHLTENNETLKDESSVQILCDSNLEETAANFTFTETVVTHKTLTRSGEGGAHDDTLDSVNVTLTNAEVNKESNVRAVCDANLEETSVESTFYQFNENQTTNKDETLKEEDQPSVLELSKQTAPANRIENNIRTFAFCDTNLEETANETAVFESYTNETTITITDSSAEQSIGRTFTVSRRVSQTADGVSVSVDESSAEWKFEEKADGVETVKNYEEKEGPVHLIGDANLEETCFDDTQSHTPTMESVEDGSVHVFVEAKASPVNSANDERLSLANELGELGMNLNQSVDVRVTASGNVSVMDDMDRTLQDDASSVSEDSRNFSSVSTGLSDSKSLAETTKSSFLPDTTQYGDVSMDITSCSVAGGADDTLTVLSTPVGKTARSQTEDMEMSFPGGIVEEQQLSTTLTSEKEASPSSSEDTMHTMELLGKESVLPSEDAPSEPKEEVHLPSVSSEVPGKISRPASRSYALPLSPIADLSRSNAGSRASTVRAASDFVCDNSPVYSRNRKYNMNDSDISFLMNENRIYDMALRNAVESPEELEKLRSNIAQLESDKAELHAKLRNVAAELDQYKSGASARTSEIDELKRKLNEVTKGKEHAERTVSDYEFIVEDLKRRHSKQKEDLHAKVISLEEELESCRAHMRSQAELTFTSSGLATELNVVKEKLLISETENDAAKRRCEELVKSLELEADKNMKLLEEIAEFSEKSEALQKEIVELQREAGEKENIHKSFEETTKKCLEMEENLKNAETALAESTEEVKRLKTQLETATSDVTLLREIQTESELELMKLKDELADAKQEAEQLQTTVTALKQDVENAASEAAEKSRLLEEALARSADMKDKIAIIEEQLDAAKRALDVTTRELGQLKDDHSLTTEDLEKTKSALSLAESKLADAEGKLEEVVKSYEKESEERKEELKSVIAAHLSEKTELENEIAESKQKVAELTQNIEKDKETVTQLEESLKKLREENNNLQSELLLGVQAYEGKAAEMEEANKRIDSLEEEIGCLRRAKDDLLLQTLSADQEKQEKIAEIEKLTSSAAEYKGMIAALELERDSLQDQLRTVKERLSEVGEAEQTIESLKADVAALTSERDDFESRLNLAEESKRELTDELNKVKEVFAQAQSESVVLASQKALLEENLQEKEKEYSEKLASFEQLRSQFAEYDATLEQLRANERNLNSELETAKRSLAAEQEAKEKMTTEVATVENEKNVLTKKLSSLETELESLKRTKLSDMNAAQKTIDELKNHEMELRKRLEVAESAAKASANSREEIAELKRLLATREKDAERLVRECEKFDELESKLTQQISELRKENDELKTQIGQMNVQVQPNLHSEQAEGQIESLKAEIERLEKANGRLEKEVMFSSCKDIKELQECLVKKQEWIEYLEKQCDEVDELEENYRKQISDLCKERDALKAQIDPSSAPAKPVVPNLLDALTEGVKPLTPDHAVNQSIRATLEEAENEIESLKLEVQALKKEKEQLEKEPENQIESLKSEMQALKKEKERLEKEVMFSSCKDIKELQECLVKKQEWIEYLEKQCDDIDELEAQYKEEIAQLCKERDALKAQIDPSSVPVVPNLQEALKKGVKMLSPDNSYNSMECKALEDYERKIDEFERIVKKLEKEKEQLQRDKSSQNDRIIQQNEELLQLCEQQRKEIEELKKDTSKEDETLKAKNLSLSKENSALKGYSKMKPAKPSLLDAVGKRTYDEEMLDEDVDKDGVFQSAPSSPKLPTRSFDSSAGPAYYEESVVENAATPNRTLHTTLYKKLDKTTKLSDTPESSKRENSRCAQQ